MQQRPGRASARRPARAASTLTTDSRRGTPARLRGAGEQAPRVVDSSTAHGTIRAQFVIAAPREGLDLRHAWSPFAAAPRRKGDFCAQPNTLCAATSLRRVVRERSRVPFYFRRRGGSALPFPDGGGLAPPAACLLPRSYRRSVRQTNRLENTRRAGIFDEIPFQVKPDYGPWREGVMTGSGRWGGADCDTGSRRAVPVLGASDSTELRRPRPLRSRRRAVVANR